MSFARERPLVISSTGAARAVKLSGEICGKSMFSRWDICPVSRLQTIKKTM